jgi:hypothetical protein
MKSRTIHRRRLLRVVLWTLVLCFNCIVAEETGERQPDYFEATEANEHDDRTLLDTFGQAAKEPDYFEATEANEYDDRPLLDTFGQAAKEPDYFEATEANEYDDRTLLDTFGQAAKEFLTQRVIPDTDADCKWDWRYVRCGKKSSVNDGILNVLISNKKANCHLF